MKFGSIEPLLSRDRTFKIEFWIEHIDFGYAPSGVPDSRTRNRLTQLIRDERRRGNDAN